MPFFDHYPYTNLHNVNLDWVLQAVKSWGAMVEQNNQNFINLEAANQSFKEYVTNYLTNLDVQDEINAKLDQMLASGDLTQYFAPYIQTDVSEWLEENLMPTTPPVDATLTIAGAAADAKAVGDRINGISDLWTESINVASYTWTNGGIATSGSDSDDESQYFLRSDYMNFPLTFTIKNKPGYTFSLFTYDKEGNLLERTTTWQTNLTKSNTGGKLYRILLKSNSGTVAVTPSDVANYIELLLALSTASVKDNINYINNFIDTGIMSRLNGDIDVTKWEWTFGSLASNGSETDNNVTSRIRSQFIYFPHPFTVTNKPGFKFITYKYTSTGVFISKDYAWVTKVTNTDTDNKLYRILIAGTGGTETLNLSDIEEYLTITSKFDETTDVNNIYTIKESINAVNYSSGLRQQMILPNLRIVYHRGVSAIAPELTIPAFTLAAERGYKYVEVDVQFTSDNVPILLHDNEINRVARNLDGTTITGTINIADITYQQALQYDFGIWKNSKYAGTKILRLDDFLYLCKIVGLHPYLEIKQNETEAHLNNIMHEVAKAGMRYNVTYISQYYEDLDYIKNTLPDAELGLNGFVSNMLQLRNGYNYVFSMTKFDTDSTKLNDLISNHIPIAYWTINTIDALLALPTDGYSAILTDGLDMVAIKDALYNRIAT